MLMADECLELRHPLSSNAGSSRSLNDVEVSSFFFGGDPEVTLQVPGEGGEGADKRKTDDWEKRRGLMISRRGVEDDTRARSRV